MNFSRWLRYFSRKDLRVISTIYFVYKTTFSSFFSINSSFKSVSSASLTSLYLLPRSVILYKTFIPFADCSSISSFRSIYGDFGSSAFSSNPNYWVPYFLKVLIGLSVLLDIDGDINKSSNTSDPYWPALVEDLLKFLAVEVTLSLSL